MLRFNPPDLHQRWVDAAPVLSRYFFAIDWPEGHGDHFRFSPPEHDLAEGGSRDAECTVDTITEVRIGNETYSCRVGDALDWVDELVDAKLVEHTVFLSKQRALVYVGYASSEEAAPVLRHKVDGAYNTSTEISGKRVSLCLRFGLTPFAFLADRYCDRYIECVLGGDTFVEVRFRDGPLAISEIHSIVRAYLFELSSSVQVDLEITRFRHAHTEEELREWELAELQPATGGLPDEDWESRWEAEEDARKALVTAELEAVRTARLRPLLVGVGLDDLIQLHAKGLSAAEVDVEYQVLCFAKAVEYVSMTVIKQQSHAQIRKRLLDPQALSPDARFIEDLIRLVEIQARIAQKDSEAIRITTHEVCDPVLLAPHAPKFLRLLTKYRQPTRERDEDRDKKVKALDELASAITATRNQIAHGKANYEASGKECPPDQMAAFAALLCRVAEQAIAWFARVPESMRVVR